MNGREHRQVPRLALNVDEAAASLGVSRDSFERHILPEIKVIRRGRRILISVRELERWISRNERDDLPSFPARRLFP
jgi:excisionase family DNA binding protein